MKYSVVIPTYNHCDDFLKPCIESIKKYTRLEDIELIISANGCIDNTKEYLDNLKQIIPNIKVVWSDIALGFARAVNLGIKASSCDKVILLNNDTQLLQQETNTWLELLESPFENDKCGISCVVKEYSRTIQKNYAVFFCVMIDRKVFDTIGYLNEDYETGSGEDMEFSILTEAAGFEIIQVSDKIQLDRKYFTGSFPIYHYGEGTVHDKELVPNWRSIFLQNALKVAHKYNEDWKRDKYMSHPKVGVITPVYNDTEHLFHAINAVKSQTYGNVIHYIYDDCSTDGLVDSFRDFMKENKNFVYMRGVENRGQAYGRNQAITAAIGDGCQYLAFLDSDDFWYPNHLEKSLDAFLSVDCDVVFSTPEFITEDGNNVRPVNIPIPQIFIGKQLKYRNYIWVSSVVAKAECFYEEKFDDNLNSIEEWEMWIRLYEKGVSFCKLPETSSRYLVRDGSEASKGSSKMTLLSQKHKMLPKLKLHLACGHDYDDDYINVDLYAPEDAKCDVRFDVSSLPYDDNSVDEIKAFHIIEHFHFFEIQEVLKEWHRVLKPGGRLYLETPDFLESCRSFVEGSPGQDIEQWRILLYNHFFAHAWIPGQTHKFLFTENQLRVNLEWAGFKTVNRLPPASKYVRPDTHHLFLTVEAFKNA